MRGGRIGEGGGRYGDDGGAKRKALTAQLDIGAARRWRAGTGTATAPPIRRFVLQPPRVLSNTPSPWALGLHPIDSVRG